jgi:hypothetical protein
MVSPIEISGQGHASYQKILVKTETPPRGLGAVIPTTQHENDPKFHLDAPLIKANKLTKENPVKQNFDLEDPGRLDRPLQAVRPPLPENQPAGQTPTSSRPISQITPQIAAKLRE